MNFPFSFYHICISLEFCDGFSRFIALFWPTLTDRHLFFPVTHWSLYSLHFGHFLSDTFFLFSFLYFTFSGFGTKVKRNQKKNLQKRWFYLKRYYILHYFDPANVGSFLPPLYAVCGGSRFHQARAWRQMGSRCCRFTVCDRLAGSFCRTWLCTAVWHVKKNVK